MAWEFAMVAGPFKPRLTEGPAWDGQALLFTHIPASRLTPNPGGGDIPEEFRHTPDPFVVLGALAACTERLAATASPCSTHQCLAAHRRRRLVHLSCSWAAIQTSMMAVGQFLTLSAARAFLWARPALARP